jgi:transcriptional regulator, MarR family
MWMDVRKYVNLLHDLKVLKRKIAHIFEKKIGISLTRFQIIKYLYEVDVATPKQLSKILEIDAAAITRHLKKLEEAGYINKRRNKENNREIYVEITEASKNKIDSCTKDTDIRNIISEDFTDDDLKKLTKLLDKFNKSLI